MRRGDCFRHLRALRDGSIDAVITDPPYGTMNAAWDVSLDWRRWWELIERKLKPTGVVACFAAGQFLFKLHESKPRWFRYDLIWEKSIAAGFLNANHAPLRAHEYILVFAPKFKAATYIPQKVASGKRVNGRQVKRANRRSTLYAGHAGGFTWADDGTRHPRSVLRFDSIHRTERGHPTQKPLELLRWLVRTYTRPGELVCDPFFGSGTTAEACQLEGRRFFGCERELRYFNFARSRLRRAA